ncbi:MAG: hypothetical protein ABR508_01495 [Candidatus Baltobacteraceae bacterium]
MLDPSKRFITLVLALGIVVLVAAIALGERAGDKVIGQVTEKRLTSIGPITVTPAPQATVMPYGPDWKRTDVMAAATDPGFPDPRIPPEPPPTPMPLPKYTLAPVRPGKAAPHRVKATPNLDVPIWRREAPLPTPTPLPSGSPAPSESPSPTAAPSTEPQRLP